MWRCNDELRARADKLQNRSKKGAKHYVGMSYYVYNFCMSYANFLVVD